MISKLYVRYWIIFLFVFIVSCRSVNSDPYPIDQNLTTDNAMVVSAHPLASEIGAVIMKNGGNAVDAAIATQFALAVVYPRAGNIGGGGFMVIRTPEGDFASLDYREKAPKMAHRDMYLDQEGNVVDSLSRYGAKAVGVPGTVAGLVHAWERYGQLEDFGKLVTPAINLAKNGYRINKDEASRLNKYRDDFIKYNSHSLPFVRDKEWESGDRIIQKKLAISLSEIKNKRSEAFYTGIIAEKLDSQMRIDGGFLRLDDLGSYQPVWRNPVSTAYDQYKIVSMGPPSSGGIALIQLLELIEPYDLKETGFLSPETIHLYTECERRVYADRAKYLGDPDYIEVPDSMLLDPEYLSDLMDDFNVEKASPSSSIHGGGPVGLESFETTHTSVVDQNGMAVSVTTTLNSNYGSKVYADGLGFFLNNEMDDFSVKPGVANQFGLVGGSANAIEPGKRMLSSMTPTIVEKNGKLWMVLGTPGGSTIITSVFQVFLNVAEFGLSMNEAVKAPRFHHQWLPDRLMYEEGRLDSLTQVILEEKGHKLDHYERIGLVKVILVKENGKIEGVGDPRSYDDAEGF